MSDIVPRGTDAQIVATVEFRPDTLFFSPPGHCWLSGHLYLGGARIGESKCAEFSVDEMRVMQEIVQRAVVRHHEALKRYGNIG